MNPKVKITLALLLILVSACSKQRKYERMVEGEKVIESYTVDGADSLTWLVDSVIRCNDYYFTFHSQNSKGQQGDIDVVGNGILCTPYGSAFICGGSWHLKNKQQTLYLYVTKNGNSVNLIIPSGDWSVVKLNASEIWLESESGNKSYEIRFKSR